MRDAAWEAVNAHLTLVEFAVQDLYETSLVESALQALVEARALCRALEKYVRETKGERKWQSGTIG